MCFDIKKENTSFKKSHLSTTKSHLNAHDIPTPFQKAILSNALHILLNTLWDEVSDAVFLRQ
jgi:hypothetical protein